MRNISDGLYTVAIIAEDSAGNTTTEGIKVIIDGNLKVGNFSITFNDLSIPMLGIPIEGNRTYDSRRRAEDLDFGYGWTIDYQNVEITESRTPGRGWEINQYGDVIFGDIPEWCIEPIGTPTTELQYAFGLDLVRMNTGTENFTYHSDALGSTRLLTNNAVQLADDVRYDAWGEQLAGGDVAENQ